MGWGPGMGKGMLAKWFMEVRPKKLFVCCNREKKQPFAQSFFVFNTHMVHDTLFAHNFDKIDKTMKIMGP